MSEEAKRKAEAEAEAEAKAKAEPSQLEIKLPGGRGKTSFPTLFQDQSPGALSSVLGRTGMPLIMPNIQLLQDTSDDVKTKKPGAIAGEFKLGPDVYLGPNFVCLVGPWRPHAKLLVDRKIQSESFDQASPEFARLCEMELQLKSVVQKGTICRVGVDFLLWLPEKQRFGLLFLASTAKAEAQNFEALKGQLGVMSARFISSSNYSWYVPTIRACDDTQTDWALPRQDQLEDAARLFQSPTPIVDTAVETKGPMRPR